MTIHSSEVRNLLSYNPSSGHLTYRKTRRGGKQIGERAGTLNKYGYRQIHINRKSYKEHNIVWLHVNGAFPPDGYFLDHINGIKDDNRIENLRLCTHTQNCYNRGSGKNYSFFNGKWNVQFRVNGVLKTFGSFDTEEEAQMVAREIRKDLHGEFRRDLRKEG